MKKIINLIISIIYLCFCLQEVSVADENQTIDPSVFQDIKPPVNLPFNSFPLIIVLIIIAVLLLGWFIWSYLKRKKSTKKVYVLPKSPHEIAYERLDELIKKELPQQGKVKEYFIEISDILRRYVERRFALKAPELTTPEFLEKIKDSNQLKSDHKLLLKEFLLCCDLVKFAKYGPSQNEIKESEALVRSFVDETKQAVKEEREASNAV